MQILHRKHPQVCKVHINKADASWRSFRSYIMKPVGSRDTYLCGARLHAHAAVFMIDLLSIK